MTSIKFPPHTNSIPVTYKVDGAKKVVLIAPSSMYFTLDLPENAELFGEFGVEPMNTDLLSGRTPERLG